MKDKNDFKKAYTAPRLTNLGDIGTVTQKRPWSFPPGKALGLSKNNDCGSGSLGRD